VVRERSPATIVNDDPRPRHPEPARGFDRSSGDLAIARSIRPVGPRRDHDDHLTVLYEAREARLENVGMRLVARGVGDEEEGRAPP
jgi:hypothetical protein